MILDGLGDPRMGELKTQGPGRAEEAQRFATHLPGYRARPEKAERRVGHDLANRFQPRLQGFPADQQQLGRLPTL